MASFKTRAGVGEGGQGSSFSIDVTRAALLSPQFALFPISRLTRHSGTYPNGSATGSSLARTTSFTISACRHRNAGRNSANHSGAND
jgi:hypothetical protein